MLCVQWIEDNEAEIREKGRKQLFWSGEFKVEKKTPTKKMGGVS